MYSLNTESIPGLPSLYLFNCGFFFSRGFESFLQRPLFASLNNCFDLALIAIRICNQCQITPVFLICGLWLGSNYKRFLIAFRSKWTCAFPLLHTKQCTIYTIILILPMNPLILPINTVLYCCLRLSCFLKQWFSALFGLRKEKEGGWLKDEMTQKTSFPNEKCKPEY